MATYIPSALDLHRRGRPWTPTQWYFKLFKYAEIIQGVQWTKLIECGTLDNNKNNSKSEREREIGAKHARRTTQAKWRVKFRSRTKMGQCDPLTHYTRPHCFI